MGDYILRKMSVFYPKNLRFFCYDKHHRTKRGKRDEPIQHISRRRRPGNRKISRQTIRTGRLQGKKAYNGMEALDILMTEQIHLILLDVMMPKMNGLSALMKIREKNNIPIIMLSAKTEESDKVIGLSMGADDYVTKPYNTAELMARVKSQLRRYFSLGAANGTTQSQDILKTAVCC